MYFRPTRLLPLLMVTVLSFLICASPSFAQLGVLTTYVSEGKAPAKNANYMKARKSAVWRALRAAVLQSLEDLLGKGSNPRGKPQVKQILSSPQRYVKSYRFLEAVDDDLEEESRVRLEVVLWTDALNKALNSAGLVSSTVNPKAVVVLILERSFTARPSGRFWDYVPMSEISLAQNLMGGGIHVIRRDRVANLVTEERVRFAARGDVTAAVDIGLKAGAGIVIVGNAASTSQKGSATGPVNVQANLSVKVVSVIDSKVIAAKSDFASARAVDPVNGELQAFEIVGEKMGDFLESTIKRYWGPVAKPAEPVKPGEPPKSAPQASKPAAPTLKTPGLMEDL